MKPMNLMVIAALAVVVGAGCSVTPHEVSMQYPDASAYQPAAKGGVPIHLTVRDDRDDDLAGKRNFIGAIGAGIKTGTVFGSFDSAVREMFSAKGYKLVARREAANARVTVRLRKTGFDYSFGWFTGGEHVSVAINATAVRGDEEYETTYRASKEERRFTVAFGEEINVKLSARMEDALR